MKKITNHYEIAQTIRLGLTLPKKVRKPNKEGDFYQSHAQLADLIKDSASRIQEQCAENKENVNLRPIEKVDACLEGIEQFLAGWHKNYKRIDQIALDKDFYRVLARKIGFQGFWYKTQRKWKNGQQMVEEVKQPQTRLILLNQLSEPYNGIKRHELITRYWTGLFQQIESQYVAAQEQAEQYQRALDLNRADQKPNEVELRKAFLALSNLVMAMLEPLYLGQISFPNLGKLDMSKPDNQKLAQFATGGTEDSAKSQRVDLINNIRQLQQYFKDNGTTAPFSRATLHIETELQDVDTKNISIDGKIKQLQLDRILRDYPTADDYFKDIYSRKNAQQKIELLNDYRTSLYTKAMLYREKAISPMLQIEIANTLSQKLPKSKEEIQNFLSSLGQLSSPAKDYADLKDKSNFAINNYPLKTAFDFAWEGCARAQYHDDADFPYETCDDFLYTYFETDIEKDKDFQLYAQLLELQALLSTLENGAKDTVEEIKDNIEELIDEIDWNRQDLSNVCRSRKYKDNNPLPIIQRYIKYGNKKDRNYMDIKKDLGLFRGTLKGRNRKYKDITFAYKKIAMNLGRDFAKMRDLLTENAELNSVTHCALILEDQNQDKYLLLQPYTAKEDEKIFHSLVKSPSANASTDSLTAFYAESVTSKAIAKSLRKAKIAALQGPNKPKFFKKLTDEEKEKELCRDWRKYLENRGYIEKFHLNLSANASLEEIKKIVDTQCYQLSVGQFSVQKLRKGVKEYGWLLLPIINQDLAKEHKTEQSQYTKNWNALFEKDALWHLSPEVKIMYRMPTPGYPESDMGDKRYSRFQLLGLFNCSYVPNTDDYLSTREQLEAFQQDQSQQKKVNDFHQLLRRGAENEPFYVFGIDRGQKELATLCIVDQNKKIVGPQKIYTRRFNPQKKQWEHFLLEERYILDLSNLRVETTLRIDGVDTVEKVLVDLSEVKVKDKAGNFTRPNKMQVKMQQLAYIRKLQFEMQEAPEVVLEWYKEHPAPQNILTDFVDKPSGEKGLVSFYGSAVEELEDTLPVEEISKMLKDFKALKDRQSAGEQVKAELDQLVQLEPVDKLKYGVVANMVGVIAHLLEKYHYNAYISLEDLSAPFAGQVVGGIAGVPIQVDANEGRRMDVEKYAGLGLYNFFEKQLLQKLFKIQQNSRNVLHLVPAFRAQKDYDHVAANDMAMKLGTKENQKGMSQFGIVFFIDANNTSICCPKCGAHNGMSKEEERVFLQKHPLAKKNEEGHWVKRDKSNGNDIIHCYACGFDTEKENTENPFKYIKSGDDNAAYLISTAGIKAYELATGLLH